MQRFSFLKQQNAQVLITVILVLTIVLALGAGILFHSRSWRNFSKLQVDTDQAYSLAKSGIEIAEHLIEEEPCNCSKEETYSLGAGTIKVKVDTALNLVNGRYEASGDYQAIGQMDQSQRTLEKTYAHQVLGWAKAYSDAGGGVGTLDRIDCLSVRATADCGYILAGDAADGDIIYVIKTDANGNVGAGFPGTWARTYGDYESSFETVSAVQASDGGYILAGEKNNDGLLLKIDGSGTIQWAKTYGGSNYDWFFSVQPISGGYILGGNTTSFTAGLGDFLLIKTDNWGTVQWAWNYGGSQGDYLADAKQTADGGYILAGSTDSFGGLNQAEWLVIKTNSDGSVAWAKSYGFGGGNDFIDSLQLTSDGYILAGNTNFFGGLNQAEWLVIKINLDGSVAWARKYTGITSTLQDVQRTIDGYILGGEGSGGWGDFFLLKTDNSGIVQWAKRYGGVDDCDYINSLYPISDGYIFGGRTLSFGTNYYNAMVVKSDAQGNVDCCSSDFVVDEVNVSSTPYVGVSCTDPSANIKVFQHKSAPPLGACDFTLTATIRSPSVACNDSSTTKIKVSVHNGALPCDFILGSEGRTAAVTSLCPE